MDASLPRYTVTSPVGIMADTHGLLRDEALDLLQECELILHLGDVGSKEEDVAILQRLEAMAPVHCVRGNIDTAAWAERLPMHQDIILHGHSHKPRNEQREGTLLFNPGAAGKRRFKLPITLGKLWIDQRGLRGAIMHLL